MKTNRTINIESNKDWVITFNRIKVSDWDNLYIRFDDDKSTVEETIFIN